MSGNFAVALSLSVLALSQVAPAQVTVLPFPGFAVADECGGIPTFLGSSYIVETANGLCGQSAISFATIEVAPLSIKITLPAGTTPQGFGIAAGDALIVAGSGLTCLASTAIYASGSMTANPLIASRPGGCPTGTYSPMGGMTLSVAFLNVPGSGSPMTRTEMRLLTKSSSSWASPPTIGYMNPVSLQTTTSYAGCSIGNPGGYTDGTNYYLVFLMQDLQGSITGCAPATSGPGQGELYDLWACVLGTGGTPSTANFTPSYCNQIKQVNVSANGAMLDPHIHGGNVYVSERNNPSVVYQTNPPTGSYSYGVWSIDMIPVTWSSPPSAPGTGNEFFIFDDAQWNSGGASSLAANGCEEYYKLTGFTDLPSGTVRAFFQANDITVNISGTVENPYHAAGVNTQKYGSGSATCDALGVGNETDAFAFSGIFYGDLVTSNPYPTSKVYAGSNFTQIYPPVSPPANSKSKPPGLNLCVTPNNNITCYGEFPWVFKDGKRIMFEGSLFTPTGTVDTCYNTSTGSGPVYCQPNYSDEWLQGEMFTDFSQSTYPMTMVTLAPMTNYNVFGTASVPAIPAGSGECAAILWDQAHTPNYQNCGLYGLNGATFGGCSRMDIDEASQTAACADQTNQNEQDTLGKSPLKRTLVVNYMGSPANGITSAYPTSIFNQSVEVEGGILGTGGIAFRQQ